MQVDLAYGRTGLSVDLPAERTEVIEPTYVPGLPDQSGAVLNAIGNPIGASPLRLMAERRHKVAIAACDITRPMPSATVIPALLRDLSHVPDDQIAIIVATGTHRANTPSELEEMLGADVAQRYRVINHDAFDHRVLTHLGDSPTGIPI